ncbi:MAG: hypothetical protein KJ950_09950 [Proteobacteria bacterium]|nr:hypothetical protein [Pseudomonadota bacterium]MBU1688978.1 hypothetical protein [Pseudomonadota bacterium]
MHQPGRPNGRIVDLSSKGAGVMNFDSSRIHLGDHICVAFQLEEASGSAIEQHYQVVNITNNRLGCTMVGSNPLLETFISN